MPASSSPLPRQRTSIATRALLQTVLLSTFTILALTTLTFFMARSFIVETALQHFAEIGPEGQQILEEGVEQLAIIHLTLGILLIGFSAILAFFFAQHLSKPLRSLADKVRRMRPGAWRIRASVTTGDEVETLDRVVADVTGRLDRLYAHLEDEVKARTEELNEQYLLDRTILENIRQGVLSTDQKGIVIGANTAALRLLKLTREDSLGKPIEDVVKLRGHRGNALPGEHLLRTSLRTGKEMFSPPDAHWSIERQDKSLLPILVSASPLIEAKKIFGAVIVLHDISEERRVDYLKSEFVSLASHQLRTPLSALRWYVELLGEKGQKLNKEQRSYVSEMELAVKRMVTLLASLLHTAKLEGEGIVPVPEDVDVVALVREMGDDCKTMAHESGLTCAVTLPTTKVHLQTDPTLLRIVLQNLVNNAVKYSRQGTVAITLKKAARGIDVVVRDQGVGIPAAEKERVFQKFFRASNVRTLDTDGNGLGLYITKSLVERLGGTIDFVSTAKGTEFTVHFPLTPPKKKK